MVRVKIFSKDFDIYIYIYGERERERERERWLPSSLRKTD